MPADYNVATVYAIKALFAGKATEGQQVKAMDWIVQHACGKALGTPFYSDGEGGERETSFLLGRNYAGDQILKLSNIDNDTMERMKQNER